jgi:hypothetical protein
MSLVDRTTIAGRTYLDLQREARRSGRPTDELIQLYAWSVSSTESLSTRDCANSLPEK